MAAVRGRGRGGGGGPRGGAPGTERRGSWRNGPPGSGGQPSPRGATPSQSSPRPVNNDIRGDPRPFSAGPAGFTDPSIASVAPAASLSGSTSERELQPWTPDSAAADPRPGAPAVPISNGAPVSKDNLDALTFGNVQSAPWNQFETNQRLTGQKSTYAQELYTTKLDRSGADYHERAERAGKLAREIEGRSAQNPHIAEERGQAVTDATKDEEERFAGVQRNPNAYVPPAFRKATGQGAVAPRIPNAEPTSPAAVAHIGLISSVESSLPATGQNSTASSSIPIPAQPARTTSDTATTTEKAQQAGATPASAPKTGVSPGKPSMTALSPNIKATETATPDMKGNKLLEAARTFKDAEMRKAEAKRQAVQKSQRTEQLKALADWSRGFKVALPMPADILPVLTKDEDKQRELAAKAEEALKTPAVGKSASPTQTKRVPDPSHPTASQGAKKIAMSIPEIPPFKARAKASPPGPLVVPESARRNIPQVDAAAPVEATLSISPQASASGADAIAAKLNPNASSFVFKPTAAAFKPAGATHSARPSVTAIPPGPNPAAGPGGPSAPPAQPPNPFFGHEAPRPSRLNSATAFNPWVHSEKIPHANTVLPQWPFKGGPPRPIPGPQGLPGGGFPGGPGSVPGAVGIPGLSHSMSQMSVSMADYDSASSHGGPSMSGPGGPGAGSIPGMQGMQGMGMPPYAQGQPYPGFRFQPGMAGGPGMPNHGAGGAVPFNPMFSPGGQGIQVQHMGPGQMHAPGQQGHMPMFFPNGMPQNPQFLPQHLHFQNAPRGMIPGQHQQHPGGGPPQGGPGGFYPPQMQGLPTPQQTPQMNPHALMPPQYPGSPMMGGGPPRPGVNASGPASQHGSSPGGGAFDRPLPVPVPGQGPGQQGQGGGA